jgi:hypothetical protein
MAPPATPATPAAPAPPPPSDAADAQPIRRRWLTRRRRLFISSLCVLILAFLAFRFFTDKPEPRYQGISLTAWLCTYDSYFSSTNFPTMAQMDQAADAVRHIGTNALPFLLRWLSDEPAPWRRKTRNTLEKLPHPFDRLGRLTDARMGPNLTFATVSRYTASSCSDPMPPPPYRH